MQIIKGTTEFELEGEYAVTIGKFDGVHRGHRELLDRITGKHDSELCKQTHNKYKGIKSAVFTFDKSPSELFSGVTLPELTTKEEKIKIFEYLGIDVLVEFPFTKETAATLPEDFIRDILVKKMHAKYIVAGEDVSYGKYGKGDAKLLFDVANSLNIESSYDVEIVKKITINDVEVSSTKIRELVSNGDMENASMLIGVPYAIHGTIVRGNQIGRTIGFPTINIEVSKDKLMPPFGVYFAEISINGKHYNGITNVGTKPTITSEKTVFAETNILDFDEDVYGENATVKLLHFQRPERKFNSIDELRNRISNDIENGKNYFVCL